MQIEIIDDAQKLDSRQIQLLEKIIAHALETETRRSDFEVSLTITDNENIRQINKEYRDMDKETDVLSFPLINFQEDENPWQNPENLNPESGEIMLGDIVISYEKAVAQAQEYGHTLNRELCYLCVHSVMHLLGYDHMNDEDKARMRKHEEAVLVAFDQQR